MKVASDLAKVKSHQLQLRNLDHENDKFNQDQIKNEGAALPVPLPVLPRTQLLPLPIPLLPQGELRVGQAPTIAQGADVDLLNKASSNEQAIKETEENPEKKNIKDQITGFVAAHVYLMLKHLYAKIESEEENIRSPYSSNLDRSRKWMKILLSTSVSQHNPCLLGPVGERPLHVCALSAYRYGQIDFLGQGNYMKDGILNGMKKFVENESIGMRQIHIPYGKDYCGLIFALMDDLKCRAKATQLGWERSVYEIPSPPFWSALQNEFLDRCKTDSLESSRRRALLTLGIYEGETIAHPMIASGDAKTLRWILTEEDCGVVRGERQLDPVKENRKR